MKIKPLLISALVALFTHQASCQSDAIQSIGASVYNLPTGTGLGANYSFRKNFKELNEGSISWSVSPAIAVRYNAVSKLDYLVDVPFLLCYNLGAYCTTADQDGMGFFIGAGAGVHYLKSYSIAYGPEFTLGLRGKVARTPLELKIGFHLDVFEVSTDLLSVHLNILLNQRN